MKDINVSGELIQVSLQRKFKKFYAHSFGIGFINRNINFLYDNTPVLYNVNADYHKYNYTNGNIQLNYLGKFYPIPRSGFSINLGITFESELYKTRDVDGARAQLDEQNNHYIDVLLNTGLSYNQKINDNWSIYAQLSGAKSVFSLLWSDFNPYNGSSYGNMGLRAQIGFIYHLSDSIKTPKEIRTWSQSAENKLLVSRTMEIKTFWRNNMRKYEIPEELAIDDWHDYILSKDTYHYQSYGVGLDFSRNRLFSSAEFSYDFHSFDLNSRVKEYFHGGGVPYGSLINYYYENDYLRMNQGRINFSAGFGLKVFNPVRKFNLIPLLKISAGAPIFNNVLNSYYNKQRIHIWDQSPQPQNTNYEWDSTFYPSRYQFNKWNFSLSLGAIFKIRIAKNVNLNTEFLFGMLSNNILVLEHFEFKDRLRMQSNIGIGYEIPLKDKVKKPKIKPPIEDYLKSRPGY